MRIFTFGVLRAVLLDVLRGLKPQSQLVLPKELQQLSLEKSGKVTMYVLNMELELGSIVYVIYLFSAVKLLRKKSLALP